jgi:adenylate kinase
LLEDLRLQVDDGIKLAAATADTTDSEFDIQVRSAAFGDLLLEVDRLRSVSEHIENLAEHHPGMEQGLISAAANIRSIATVLDVFTLIRSKAGGPPEDAPYPQSNRYMN